MPAARWRASSLPPPAPACFRFARAVTSCKCCPPCRCLLRPPSTTLPPGRRSNDTCVLPPPAGLDSTLGLPSTSLNCTPPASVLLSCRCWNLAAAAWCPLSCPLMMLLRCPSLPSHIEPPFSTRPGVCQLHSLTVYQQHCKFSNQQWAGGRRGISTGEEKGRAGSVQSGALHAWRGRGPQCRPAQG